MRLWASRYPASAASSISVISMAGKSSLKRRAPVYCVANNKFSGSLPAQRINELLDWVEKLQQAVKYAREEANNIEAEEPKVSERMFNYLFG